jgi:hypothetical protein
VGKGRGGAAQLWGGGGGRWSPSQGCSGDAGQAEHGGACPHSQACWAGMLVVSQGAAENACCKHAAILGLQYCSANNQSEPA